MKKKGGIFRTVHLKLLGKVTQGGKKHRIAINGQFDNIDFFGVDTRTRRMSIQIDKIIFFFAS